MAKGKIIFLNGVSSSGKSTLAAKLQKSLPEAYFVFCADLFMEMISPAKGLGDYDGEAKVQFISAMYHAIRALSDAGFNMIVDDLFLKDNFSGFEQCVELLRDCPVLFVRVTCPLDELRRREKARGDREIGQGEGQLALLNPQDTYDITVDTSGEDCIDRIIDALCRPEDLAAFRTLWSQRI